MTIRYELTGAKRKALVEAISQELNTPSKYLGAPHFAYQVGDYIIDRDGTLTGDDNWELVANLQGLHSLVPTSAEYSAPTAEEAPEATDNLTFEEELGAGRQRRDYPGEDGMLASDCQEPQCLTIEMPLDGFDPAKLDNLCKLVTAKESLIKAALGTDEIPIQVNGTIKFPWFKEEELMYCETVNAYSAFISLLCENAKAKKRITAKEKPIDGSPKYAMRCFLLSIGMIGAQYKAARKILLSKLEGNSSWKNGAPIKEQEATAEETTHAEAI